MEAIPLQVMDLLDAMVSDSGHAMPRLRVDGGVTVNELVMQTLADLLDVPVDRALVPESTALGAAYLAGYATGVWSQPADLPALKGVSRTFKPAPDAKDRYADLKAPLGGGCEALPALGTRVANASTTSRSVP